MAFQDELNKERKKKKKVDTQTRTKKNLFQKKKQQIGCLVATLYFDAQNNTLYNYYKITFFEQGSWCVSHNHLISKAANLRNGVS